MADDKDKLQEEQLKDVNGGGGAIHNGTSDDGGNGSVWIGGGLELQTTPDQGVLTK